MTDWIVYTFVNLIIVIAALEIAESLYIDQRLYLYASKKGKIRLALRIAVVMGSLIYLTYITNVYLWFK